MMGSLQRKAGPHQTLGLPNRVKALLKWASIMEYRPLLVHRPVFSELQI
jgi:hypothetical protein